MNFQDIINRLQLAFLKSASSERKIRYFRKQGMKIGNQCHFNTISFSTEPYLIEIGDHVAIAAGTDFITHDGAVWCFRDELVNADVFGKIKIGNNVFIGNNCTILPKTIIGDNCIIGAGSIIRGKFPENVVILGNPARIIMEMRTQKVFYIHSPGLLTTQNLSDSGKKKIIKDHFKIK